MQLIEEELGQPVEAIFSELSPEPVAAASLGQVSTSLGAPRASMPGISGSLPAYAHNASWHWQRIEQLLHFGIGNTHIV